MMVPKPTEKEGQRIDEHYRKNKYVRKIPEYAAYGLWCDRCRVWFDEADEKRHRHEERPLD